jgi:hypothetical protein
VDIKAEIAARVNNLPPDMQKPMLPASGRFQLDTNIAIAPFWPKAHS